MYLKNWPACRIFMAALACFVVQLSAAHAADTPIVRDSSVTNEKIEELVRRIWEEKWCPPNSLCLDPNEKETVRLSGNHTYEWIVVHYDARRLSIRADGDLVLVAHRVLLGDGKLSLSIGGRGGKGKDGAAGRHGGDGGDGPDLTIRLGIVDASIAPTLGLPSFREQLPRIKIWSYGGDGGDGGNGGNGGDGGDGGNGGDNGEVHVTVWRSAYAEEATHVGPDERGLLKDEIRTRGGAGGRGGVPGLGGLSGENGENGTSFGAGAVEFPTPDIRKLRCEWEWLGKNQDPPQSSELRDKLEEECAMP